MIPRIAAIWLSTLLAIPATALPAAVHAGETGGELARPIAAEPPAPQPAATGHAAAGDETPSPRVSEKPVIERKDDLPRHTYQLDIPVTSLYLPEHRATLRALADSVARDIRSDLATYEIRDDNTLQEFYGVLGSVAALEGRWQDYLALLQRRRALESKEANRLTMGLFGEALARAKLDHPDAVAPALRRNLVASLEGLPYPVVQNNLKSSKGSTEILSRALVLGNLESSYQPVLDKTGGRLSYDIASNLVAVSFTLDYFIPNAPLINEVYAAYIAANDVAKPDIWESRKVALPADAKASPVVVAIWDSGVDTDIFAPSGQLWTNEDEIPDNGRDDDQNGYVDDVHGVAYDLHANKEVALLYPMGEIGEDEALLQRRIKGLGDIRSNVDSPEATALRKRLAELSQDEVKTFLESLNLYGNYAHGTHVAGIAAESNPFVRLLVARMTYGHTLIPEEPTIEQAQRDAQMTRDVVAYFRVNGVRAVNMSWGGSLRGIEEALEAHNAGGTPEERKALAREIYRIGDTALREAISGAPEILFITSAGNSDNDVKFDEFYPSSYDYPNMLSVGAVDAAGDETSFTSLGKVDIYANGFEVESFVPGGNRIRFNGTSMSSPQVLNLAAKLLALEPDLSTADLRRLILQGADERSLGDRTIRLMNPKASVSLLQ
ncbi:MAG: S8 family serine peptidase [Halioglobus sp.]